MKFLHLIILALCIGAVFSAGPGNCPQCRRCTRYQYTQVRRCNYGIEYYYHRCGFWNWGRCRKTRSRCQSYKLVPIRQCIQWTPIPGCVCP